MKKLFYAVPVLGMLFSSCSSEEPTGGKGNYTDAQVTNYLTVNIVPTVSPGTRAGEETGDNVDGDNVDGGKGGNYLDGTESEQKVNSVRFFFFDSKGNGAPVSVVTTGTGTTNVSYIDWNHYDSDLGPGDEDETVEATISATLGLTIPDGVDPPASMIAVINPSDAVLSLTGGNAETTGPTMTQVQTAVADFESGLTDGNFVMSNSVYANTGINPAEIVDYTSLEVGEGETPYFQSSIEAAQANPVTVYVERVVARLDLKIGLTANSNGFYPVMKKVIGGEDIQVTIDVNGDGEEEPIFVKFLGWNVTSTPSQSYLVKMIDPAWTSKQLFGPQSNWLWNSMDFHRSFWAMNPEEISYKYGNFGNESGKNVAGNYQPAQGNKMPANGQWATTYMLENASPYNGVNLNPENPTQVILAAQLVTSNGAAVPLAEWGYKKYTQSGLLNYLVSNIISNGKFYKKISDNNYVSLQPTDLMFISAAQMYPDGLPDNVESYYSYIVVNKDPSTTWYEWNGEGEKPTANTLTPVEASDIDAYILNNVGYTMMWNSGYAYYYFDVRHLGELNSPAYYGIVRNHVYQATVKTLYGFGTPVCNPDEIIIPQTPEYEEVLISADIKILQWRVVSADYTLEWR